MSVNNMVTPAGTYRLQLNGDFPFECAAKLTDYLADLGISHAYLAPVLQAAPGSQHGYDVVDHQSLNAELGGAAGFERLVQAMHHAGLGIVLDIVPNHMALAGRRNRLWWQVLRHGRDCPEADTFDINWHPREPRLAGRVLLPVLGEHIGKALAEKKLQLQAIDDAVELVYFDQTFPLSPAVEASLKQQAVAGKTLRQVLDEFNADPDKLLSILDRQHYRLAHWRTSGWEVNYRRFFAIDSLAAIRQEHAFVFEESHRLLRDWLSRGWIQGLRIDHPDGLRDPQAYLEHLRELAPGKWIVVEKILASGERLPPTWPVEGTTGYDFLALVNGLLIDPSAESAMTDYFNRYTGQTVDFAESVWRAKRQMLHELFGGELNRLTDLMQQICDRHPEHRDHMRQEIYEALQELGMSWTVYRTYIRPDQEETLRAEDRQQIDDALAAARHRSPHLAEILDFLARILWLEIRTPNLLPVVQTEPQIISPEDEFIYRFQQLSGAVMAKGVEDTAFYRFNRLVGLNEVGGNPGRFGSSLEKFHETCCFTQQHWPLTMTSTSTHDTKHSEDVRARLAVLSEMPQTWQQAVERWTALLDGAKTSPDMPCANDIYMFFQNLAGAWPITQERMQAYMRKAGGEAKCQTSWIWPNAAYEAAVQKYIAAAYANPAFLHELEQFVAAIRPAGRMNALSQVLLKCMAPGVPDFYQGCELWDLSLADPDNRRRVDFDLRRQRLQELEGCTPEKILQGMDEGLPKLYLIQQALQVRKMHPEAFGRESTYEALPAAGPAAEHVVAFCRASRVVAIAPRRVLHLPLPRHPAIGASWQNTTLALPSGVWVNALTHESLGGGRHEIGEILRQFPVAILVKNSQQEG